MKLEKTFSIHLTSDEENTLKNATDILDELNTFIEDNDLSDDYCICEAFELLRDIADEDGHFDFEGRE